MTRVRVKICGIRDESTLRAAVEAGADAVGFVVAAPSSPRCLEIGRAAALMAVAGVHATAVAVTRHPEPAQMARLFAAAEPACVQTDLADFAAMDLPPGWQGLPVLRGRADARALGHEWTTVLCEGADSGRGEVGDWQFAAEMARERRVVLAGGLDADNVGSAIRAVRPFAVDVSSGVESAPGIKDIAAIKAFIAAVRQAENEVV